MTLYVDYGNERIEYPYTAGIDWPIRKEQWAWCQETFKSGEWHYYNHEGAFYFKKEKDLMLFKLRWL
jgi:hypothetical protein